MMTATEKTNAAHVLPAREDIPTGRVEAAFVKITFVPESTDHIYTISQRLAQEYDIHVLGVAGDIPSQSDVSAFMALLNEFGEVGQ